MVKLRSGKNIESATNKMTGKISDEIKNYFHELLKPLATNELIEKLFNKLNDITSKFEAKFIEQKRQIEQLNGRIEELESNKSIKNNIIEKLCIKSDDLESYSRRSCLRIHGIPTDADETPENLFDKVEDCYDELNLPYLRSEIDRVHRIGKEYTDINSDKKVQSLIVKFKSWESRENFYRSRPKLYEKRCKETSC